MQLLLFCGNLFPFLCQVCGTEPFLNSRLAKIKNRLGITMNSQQGNTPSKTKTIFVCVYLFSSRWWDARATPPKELHRIESNAQ